jgi:hypothetical protein
MGKLTSPVAWGATTGTRGAGRSLGPAACDDGAAPGGFAGSQRACCRANRREQQRGHTHGGVVPSPSLVVGKRQASCHEVSYWGSAAAASPRAAASCGHCRRRPVDIRSTSTRRRGNASTHIIMAPLRRGSRAHRPGEQLTSASEQVLTWLAAHDPDGGRILRTALVARDRRSERESRRAA